MTNPICPIHNTEMRPSKYGKGQFYCGNKIGDGDFCKQKTTLAAEPPQKEPPPPPPPPPPSPHAPLDKERAIARAVALKGAVDLVAGGKVDFKDVLALAEKLEDWLNRE